MTTATRPILAPPGAGLPFFEHLVARIMFAYRLRTGSREAFEAAFASQRRRIAALVDPLDATRGAQRVLIERPRGLEDSSRDWSVWMTLEHLRVVNQRVAGVLLLLPQGKTPAGVANTADVKPAEADASVRAAYETSCDEVLAAARSVADLHTSTRFAHPWFGPLDAFAWFALAGGHMRIHREQIERIVAGL